MEKFSLLNFEPITSDNKHGRTVQERCKYCMFEEGKGNFFMLLAKKTSIPLSCRCIKYRAGSWSSFVSLKDWMQRDAALDLFKFQSDADGLLGLCIKETVVTINCRSACYPWLQLAAR